MNILRLLHVNSMNSRYGVTFRGACSPLADKIWPTRNRGQFYRFIPTAVGEISIRDTVHADAQYPNGHTLRAFEDEPDDTEEAQIAFVSALIASAFSLAATGSIDYAWNSFEDAFKKGIFFNGRRK